MVAQARFQIILWFIFQLVRNGSCKLLLLLYKILRNICKWNNQAWNLNNSYFLHSCFIDKISNFFISVHKLIFGEKLLISMSICISFSQMVMVLLFATFISVFLSVPSLLYFLLKHWLYPMVFWSLCEHFVEILGLYCQKEFIRLHSTYCGKPFAKYQVS